MNDERENLLKYVPGFRTMNKRNMIIAVIYYLLMIYECVLGNLYAGLIGFILPAAVFSLWDTIKYRSFKKSVPLIIFLIFVAIFASSFLGDKTDSNRNELISNNYNNELSDGEALSDSVIKVSSDGKTEKALSEADIKAKELSEKISALVPVTLESKEDIEYVESEYSKADDDVKKKVTNVGELIDARVAYTKLCEDEKLKQEQNQHQETLDGEITAEPGETPQAEEVQTQNEPETRTVYIGKTGTKYHGQGCHTLKGGGTPILYDEAIAQGRQACKVCGG